MPNFVDIEAKYQPSGAGGTCSPSATPHRLQHLTACLIQNGQQGMHIGKTLAKHGKSVNPSSDTFC